MRRDLVLLAAAQLLMACASRESAERPAAIRDGEWENGTLLAVRGEHEGTLLPSTRLRIVTCTRDEEFGLPRQVVHELETDAQGFALLEGTRRSAAQYEIIQAWARIDEQWEMVDGAGWWAEDPGREERSRWPHFWLLRVAPDQRYSSVVRLVDEDGNSIAGAKLRLCLGEELLHADHMPTGTTDEGGMLHVRHLTYADWKWVVEAPGFARYVFRPTMQGDEEFPSGRSEIVLRAERELELRLEGQRARELEAVWYWTEDDRPFRSEKTFVEVRAGRAVLSIPSRGTLVIRAERGHDLEVYYEGAIETLPIDAPLVLRVDG
jgi:hypothetical protein